MYVQEEQKNEETQPGVGSAAKFSKGKTRRKDERNRQGAGKKGREQARNTLLVPVRKARGLAVKHSAQERHANRLPGVRLFCEVLIK